MSKHINHNAHRIVYEKLYSKYLSEAAGRGWFTPEEVKFYSAVNKKAKKNIGFSPFRHVYRQTYRTGISFNPMSFGKNS